MRLPPPAEVLLGSHYKRPDNKPTPEAGPGQKNIYKISYVEWCDGKLNTFVKHASVAGLTQGDAVRKLRVKVRSEISRLDGVSTVYANRPIEVVGIEHQGVLDIE